MDNKNLPAFPVECTYKEDGTLKGLQTGGTSGWEAGLTKREYFAAMALQGLLGCDSVGNTGRPGEEIAKTATYYADALLEELSKPQP